MIKMNEDKWKFTPDKLMPVENIINDIEETHYIDAYLGDPDFEIDSILYYLKDYKQLQNNWNELKNRTQKKIEQLECFNEQLKTSPYTPQIETLKLTLKDMQELEQGKDE